MGVKNDLAQINLGMRRHQRLFGEYVKWFEYNESDSTQHNIYSEGPSRMWYPPVVLPIFFGAFVQTPGTNDDDGLYTVADFAITFQVTEAMNRFRIDPRNTELHYRDRFSYADHLYYVARYEKQGFLHGTYLTISVRGSQIMPEQMVEDAQPLSFFNQILTY